MFIYEIARRKMFSGVGCDNDNRISPDCLMAVNAAHSLLLSYLRPTDHGPVRTWSVIAYVTELLDRFRIGCCLSNAMTKFNALFELLIIWHKENT